MVEPSGTVKAPEGEDLRTGVEFAIREEIFDEWPDAESMLERVFGMTVLREELHSNLSTERLRWIRLHGPAQDLSAAKDFVTGLCQSETVQQTYPVGLLCIFEGARGLFLHALVWTTTAHVAVLDEGTLCITGSPEACARVQSHLVHFDRCCNLCGESVQSVEPTDAAAVKHAFRNVVEKTPDRFYSELLLLPTDLKRELLHLVQAHNPLRMKHFPHLSETRGALVLNDVMPDVPSSSEAKQDVDAATPCAPDPYSNVRNRHRDIATKPCPFTPTLMRSDDVTDNAPGSLLWEDRSPTVKLDDVNGHDFERDGILPIKDDMGSTWMKDKDPKHCEVFHSQREPGEKEFLADCKKGLKDIDDPEVMDVDLKVNGDFAIEVVRDAALQAGFHTDEIDEALGRVGPTATRLLAELHKGRRQRTDRPADDDEIEFEGEHTDVKVDVTEQSEVQKSETSDKEWQVGDSAGASGMNGTEEEKGKESETEHFEFPSCSSPPGPVSQRQSSVTFQLRLVNSPGRHDLRHVIIDGSDVALAHGRRVFSCRGVAICVQHFWQRGHRNLMVFVPQHEAQHQPNMPERRLLRQLEDLGLLSFIPSRVINGVRIFSHEHRFLLHLAEKTEGVIVTNANLNALASVSLVWRRIIGER
uniref:NEDD4-binding protein 1-like n=1 Tax=Myxine glutinosa TaxID=7769 RepID=UPI00358E08B1